MHTTSPSFATPLDAEEGFYQSLGSANLDALMAVWADEDDIVCIDPDGRRATGHAAIRQGWQTIFAAAHHLEIEVTGLMRWHSGLLAVHLVQENITLFNLPQNLGAAEQAATLLKRNGTTTALNVYVRGSNGWRLVCHQTTVQMAALEAQLAAAMHTLH